MPQAGGGGDGASRLSLRLTHCGSPLPSPRQSILVSPSSSMPLSHWRVDSSLVSLAFAQPASAEKSVRPSPSLSMPSVQASASSSRFSKKKIRPR